MLGPKTRLFFGNDTTKPVHRATDLIDYLHQDQRHHYQDGYSMAEAAKSWVTTNGRLPASIANVVGSDVYDTAYFEYGVWVWGGGKSMTDIMAFMPGDLIAEEAKERETFGELVEKWIYEDKAKSPASVPNRLGVVDRYAQAFGVRAHSILGLRYQLLHRTLSAALVARQYGRTRAWMIVQSFAPMECYEHARNRGDFDRFVALVGPAPVLEGIPVRLAWVDEGRAQ